MFAYDDEHEIYTAVISDLFYLAAYAPLNGYALNEKAMGGAELNEFCEGICNS
jgi:hypothetical protein